MANDYKKNAFQYFKNTIGKNIEKSQQESFYENSLIEIKGNDGKSRKVNVKQYFETKMRDLPKEQQNKLAKQQTKRENNMARMTKAEKLAAEKKAAKNARRNERRRATSSAKKQFNDAFGKQATKMGFSGQLTPRQTAQVTAELKKKKGFDKLMSSAKITETRGGTLEIGSGE